MEPIEAQILRLSNDFHREAAKAAGGNKAAGARARKLSLEITALFKNYRKHSLL